MIKIQRCIQEIGFVLSDYSTYKHPFSIPIAHNLLGIMIQFHVMI